MQTSEFLTKIKESFLAEFPDSFISVNMSKNLYHSITVICHIGKPEEWEGRIRHNDPVCIQLSIDLMTGAFPRDHEQDSIMPDNLRLEFERSHYTVKTENKYLYCEHKKFKGRLTKGDANKIIATLEKYFKNAKATLAEDLANGLIMDKHTELIGRKLNI